MQGWTDLHEIVSVGEPEELKFHILVTGNDLNCHKDILKSLGIIDEGISMEQCDVIIAFVPILSRAGTDIQDALQMIPESHPAVLVGLHHTFDPDHVAPDSGRNIDRSNIFSVDMLFYENMGMLNSYKNTKALEGTTKYLQKFKANRNKIFNESHALAIYIMALGNTLGAQIRFLDRLEKRLKLRQVNSKEECAVIIAFTCVVSQAETDVKAALENIPTDKPVLLVVFHHTFDESYIAPDSRWIVKREGVAAVDVLFHEDKGPLRCEANDMAMKSSTDYLISLGASELEPINTGRKYHNFWIIAVLLLVLLFLVLLVPIVILILECLKLLSYITLNHNNNNKIKILVKAKDFFLAQMHKIC
ncbi:uncharacterized protein LOC113660629 isoform X2 [Tachysurus fulvidraco]|uniref:uncharacterized protein LOC113660629 isoform X2 n=1 Tax=Tachysurus fulvidraco TaxID=1234273 RepID=UPI001FEF6B20|nr:uncharacterized protein LOC113660629 isoform X2 [Tachysurus fulvidraco]